MLIVAGGLALWAFVGTLQMSGGSKSRSTRLIMQTLAYAHERHVELGRPQIESTEQLSLLLTILQDESEMERLPVSADWQTVTDDLWKFRDSWGHPLAIRSSETIHLVSAGRDGRLGSVDDLRVPFGAGSFERDPDADQIARRSMGAGNRTSSVRVTCEVVRCSSRSCRRATNFA